MNRCSTVPASSTEQRRSALGALPTPAHPQWLRVIHWLHAITVALMAALPPRTQLTALR